jgi:hypothetical protein
MDEAVSRARQRENDGEVYPKIFLQQVAEFFDRLRDVTAPPINPILELCTLLALNRTIAARSFNYSYSRWSTIEAGAIESVPTSVLLVVESLGGPDGRMEFEAAWSRFRANLSLEARQTLEKRLLPVGPGAMCRERE